MESVNEPLVVRVLAIVEDNTNNYSSIIDEYLKRCKSAFEKDPIKNVVLDFNIDASSINNSDLYIIGSSLNLGDIYQNYSYFFNLQLEGLCSIIILKLENGRLAIQQESIHQFKVIEQISTPPKFDFNTFKKIKNHIDVLAKNKRKYNTPYYNKIAKILKNAEKSTHIDLSGCALKEIPSEVYKLTQLETLIINGDFREVTDSQKIIENNTLQKSKYGYNDFDRIENINFIEHISDEILDLKKLKYFSLQGTAELRIPMKSLQGLRSHPTVKVLNLSYCEISSLKEFESLPKLEQLELTCNNITKLDIDPHKMSSLITINLEKNSIDEIVNEKIFIILLNQIEYINLKGNPINLEWLNPTILEASGDNKDEILKLLTLSLKGLLNRVDTLPQKIILLGNSEVGKTELSKVLIKDKGQFPDKGTTHGLKIRQWELGAKFKNKSLFIYDFGGQDFYHSVYNMFFTFDTIYIIVWDDKRLENQSYLSTKSNDTFIKYNPSHWLKNIQYFLNRDKSQNFNQHIEIISLHNSFKSNIDYQHLAINMDGLNHHFTLNLKETSKQLNRIKIDLLKQSIFEICNQFDDKFSLSHNDIDIFNHVLKVFKENNYKKYLITEFYQEFGTPDYTSFLKVLHQKGIVFYLSDHDLLKDYVWINPSTISERIYQIMDKAALLNKGEISENEFDSKISQDIDLKNLLIHQEILFRDDSEYMSKIIVPQYLPLASTDDFLLELASEGMETLFAIRFQDFMPHGLMSRLMCRLGRNPGRKVLKRNEFICRLCISLPEEKTETIKINPLCGLSCKSMFDII